MLAEIFVRYIHFGAIFVFGTILVQIHLDKSTNIQRFKRLSSFALVSIFVAIGSGLGLWFFVGKGAEFYSHNGLFHLKVTLVVLLGILSGIMVFYRGANAAFTQSFVNGMLVIFSIVPLLAIFMALGVGYYGGH